MSAAERCDLLVVGSGAAGLAAAVTAARHGLSVVLVEKAPVLGGATAWSGGWLWVPRNPHARAAGIEEPPEAARAYLRAVLGNRYEAARVEAYLEAAPAMVAFMEAETELRFVPGHEIPDIYGALPGAAERGRQLAAAPLDGRELGPLLARLRLPLPETAFLGMPIMAGADLAAFLSATRSWASARHVARRVGRHLLDLARHGRAAQLVNGQALVGRLLLSAARAGVRLSTDSPALALLLEGGAVRGARIGGPGGEREIRAARGVVLATGGFPHDPELRRALAPRPELAAGLLPLPPEECTGDGIRLARAAGARLASDLASPFAWCPVSRIRRPDGTIGRVPHIHDRGKPGTIAVRADGRRFCNEADGYHDYVAALLRATPAGERPVSWLVADHGFLRRWGLGCAKPFPVPLRPHLRSGYLRRAPTLAGLARLCGIDPAGLEATVARWNEQARRGLDPDFGRGSSPYNRKQGDPRYEGPSPTLAPIETPPFYAVEVEPGCFGTFAGLATDAAARVLDEAGRPIPGLWAAGTDAASVMGGHYPSGGINLGPALTFGYIAGRDAAAAGPAPSRGDPA